MDKKNDNKQPVTSSSPTSSTNTSNWSWFNVSNLTNPMNNNNNNNDIEQTSNDLEFEVVQQDISLSNTRDHSRSISISQNSNSNNLLIDNNYQINDQYVIPSLNALNINNNNDDDDDQKCINNTNNDNINSNNINIDNQSDNDDISDIDSNNNSDDDDDDNDNVNDAVMISQTLTLQTRNAELEKERDDLHSETLKLRMQTECLKQSNKHIISAQQQELEILQTKNIELEKLLNETQLKLKTALQDVLRTRRERDNLQIKLADISINNNNTNVTIISSDNYKNCIIYTCNNCGSDLFDSRSIIQHQIEMNDNKFGCLVDELFNNNEITMGPKICKTFLNGMFKVNQIFCDGCLSPFGWKIIEAFEEWNSFHQNKYWINIKNIKQITR